MRMKYLHLLAGGMLATLGACSEYDPRKDPATYSAPPGGMEQPAAPEEPATAAAGRSAYDMAVTAVVAATAEVDARQAALDTATAGGDQAVIDAANTALTVAQDALTAANTALEKAAEKLVELQVAEGSGGGTSADASSVYQMWTDDIAMLTAEVDARQAALDTATAGGDQAAIDAARTALTEAQTELAGANTAVGAASMTLSDLQVAEVVAGSANVHVMIGEGFGASVGAAVVQVAEVERTDRTDAPGVLDADETTAAEEGAILTDIAEDAVAYADGKALAYPSTVASDEFPLRQIVARGNIALEEDSIGSAQLGVDGLVIRFGGEASRYSDSRRDLAVRVWRQQNMNGESDDNDRVDLAIGFGSPKADPANDKISYWETAVEFPNNVTRDAMGRARTVSWNGEVTFVGRENLGTYQTWLSNFAGIDDMGNQNAADDEDLYLAYAAYGLFHFMDNALDQGGMSGAVERIVGEASDGDAGPRTGRMQAFHFGLDAFSDTTGNTASDGMTVGAYSGRTEALYQTFKNHRTDTNDQPVRLQGDVSLTVVDSSGLKISGTISGIEGYDGSSWTSYASLTAVDLDEGVVAADGSYTGVASMNAGSGIWEDGAYGGAFYGPMASPETAGHWTVSTGTGRGSERIVGAFGAAKMP